MIKYESVAGSTVCICAPTRSSSEVADLERRLGLAGASVLAPVPPGGQLSEYERAALTALHQRKIEAADLVVVANASGYTGIGTCAEIAYALRLGRPVTFLQDPVDLEIDPDGYAGLVSRAADTVLLPADELTAQLAVGTVLTVSAPGEESNATWMRVAGLLRFTDRAQALAAIDPARVRPGMDRAALAAWLEENRPGSEQSEHVLVDVEFIAELRDPPHRIEHGTPARVNLLARDPDGRVLLACQTADEQAWHLPYRAVVDGDDVLAAAIGLACDLGGLPYAMPVLVALDYTTTGGHHRIAEYVFATADLHHQAPAQARFTAPEEIRELADPRTARVISAALAQFGRPGAVVCEHGYGSGQRIAWQWHEQAQPPTGVPVTQAGVWAFDEEGRVLLQYREARRAFALPAGSTEPEDRDQLASAAREAFEESQVVIDQRRAVLLGYQVTYADPRFPNGLAQARYAAPILAYHPAGEDTDPKLTGRRPAYRRYLVDVRHAAALLDYGPHAEAQARAAEQAAREMGIPVDRPAADGYRDHGDPGIEPARGWELTL